MLFAIIATDIQDSLEKRLQVRDQHLARLRQLKEEGRLVIAGPHPETDQQTPEKIAYTGSLIVAEFDSLVAAQAWADSDPYIKAGVYAQVIVKPFNRVNL
jgi:uncharacterized protein YciI